MAEDDENIGPMQAAMLGQQEILQAVEDALLDQGYDEVIIQTQSGSFTWRTFARQQELEELPEGGEPTAEEYDTAVRLLAASPEAPTKLSESIAREFSRRRLAGHAT